MNDPKHSSAVRPWWVTPWPISLIILICVVTEVLLLLGDWGVLASTRLRFSTYEYLGFWPGLLADWRPNYALQPYTMFLSYAFLHGGLVHLIFNMVTLRSLGIPVVERVGRAGFLLLYTASVLGGGLCFGLLAQNTSPMVGASGGLFGLAGGILAWQTHLGGFVAGWVVALLIDPRSHTEDNADTPAPD